MPAAILFGVLLVEAALVLAVSQLVGAAPWLRPLVEASPDLPGPRGLWLLAILDAASLCWIGHLWCTTRDAQWLAAMIAWASSLDVGAYACHGARVGSFTCAFTDTNGDVERTVTATSDRMPRIAMPATTVARHVGPLATRARHEVFWRRWGRARRFEVRSFSEAREDVMPDGVVRLVRKPALGGPEIVTAHPDRTAARRQLERELGIDTVETGVGDS